jgi:CheY-like chemotaxis protein
MPKGDLSGLRVLVVEDEFFIADDLLQALQEQGAQVLGPVQTKGQALALLSGSEQIDFAVLDVNLHGETDFCVADALSARGIPFVMATGYTRETLPPRFRHVPYWEKPYDPTALARSLSTAI